jgi:hypothetical protein
MRLFSLLPQNMPSKQKCQHFRKQKCLQNKNQVQAAKLNEAVTYSPSDNDWSTSQ